MSAILVVDDDVKIARIIARYLEQAGFAADLAHDGGQTAKALAARPYDLVILDILLPDTSGLKILGDLRGSGEQGDGRPALPDPAATAPDVPVLLLSALGMTDDIISGLRCGADDYMVKPFEPRELVERVRALLRRQRRNPDENKVRAGGLEVDPAARQARYRDQALDLTRREFDLLLHLASHPGRVFSRNQLLDAVWGDDFDGGDRSVDLCVLRLRGKLDNAQVRGVKIDTSWGSGYRLTVAPDNNPGPARA